MSSEEAGTDVAAAMQVIRSTLSPCLTLSWDQETLTFFATQASIASSTCTCRKASVNLIAILDFTPKIYPIGKLH